VFSILFRLIEVCNVDLNFHLGFSWRS
jgi:hypothetical protein